MPEGAVYVGRPSIYGNPYRAEHWGAELCVAIYRETIQGCWNPNYIQHLEVEESSAIYGIHCEYLRTTRRRIYLPDLRGKDLACWCPVGAPCHGDVLLELANR